MRERLFPVAILAGGLATRLRPLTETVPKALLNVCGEPFIAHQLRLLKREGIERVVICAGYLGEMIRDFVGNGSDYGIDVVFSFDGEHLLGTGGAIKKALPRLGDSFFVLYGDSYLLCDFRAIQSAFLRSGKSALMTVFHNNGQWDVSNVEYRDGEIHEYDKHQLTPRMHHIDYGLGVFRSNAFDGVPFGQPCDMCNLYKMLLQKGELGAFEVQQRFYEVGSFGGLEEFQHYLSQLGA